jgi:DNA invertase Pin-like site-specific DNA recombinase
VGLDAQRAAIEAYAERAGLSISHWYVDEGVGGAMAPDQRPQLSAALFALSQCRKGGVLLVAKPDRLVRKASDLLKLRDRAEAEYWVISTADGPIDMSTPHGRAMATVMGAFAELERDLIRARTREAWAAQGGRSRVGAAASAE